jgi:hypothetical protein
MSLLDEAVSLQAKPGTPCSVQALKEANPELHAEVMEALATSVYATAISKALEKRGVYIRSDALNRHRRGECERCR